MSTGLMRTRKLYYEDPYALQASTDWLPRSDVVIALKESIAFPEGGGQLGDRGEIRQGNRVARFRDTTKYLGRPVFYPDFPVINVEGEVRLTLETSLSPGWDLDAPITVSIDRRFRAAVTQSHTAAHLVYVGMLEALPGAASAIIGCYIEPTGGRFDLRSDTIDPEQLEQIHSVAAEWQKADYLIEMDSLPGEPECRIWICNGIRIPCGGTHLPSTGLTGPILVRRRTKGKGRERIYYTLEDDLPEQVDRLYDR